MQQPDGETHRKFVQADRDADGDSPSGRPKLTPSATAASTSPEVASPPSTTDSAPASGSRSWHILSSRYNVYVIRIDTRPEVHPIANTPSDPTLLLRSFYATVSRTHDRAGALEHDEGAHTPGIAPTPSLVSKTVIRRQADRGFKSLPLRWQSRIPQHSAECGVSSLAARHRDAVHARLRVRGAPHPDVRPGRRARPHGRSRALGRSSGRRRGSG
jgi:hypothetical protein